MAKSRRGRQDGPIHLPHPESKNKQHGAGTYPVVIWGYTLLGMDFFLFFLFLFCFCLMELVASYLPSFGDELRP